MRVELMLQGQSERRAGPEQPDLLYHQLRTEQELRTAPLVMNTYNTGTGQTRDSLLHLSELPRDGESHVLFIAPTNELLHQHANDIRAFVEEFALPFLVVELNAKRLHALADPDSWIAKVRGWCACCATLMNLPLNWGLIKTARTRQASSWFPTQTSSTTPSTGSLGRPINATCSLRLSPTSVTL